ncbi:Tricarboxylate/iron carrier [Mrakia frigida]|uniref:Fsf1p n=1 Tax=Mrakia frigida TaxID=29902 RepID=UPI003FCC11BC
MSTPPSGQVDLSAPQFNLSTYKGRLSHFYSVTSPLTLLVPSAKLEEASSSVKDVQSRIDKANGAPVWVAPKIRDEYWGNKQLVDSSIHPDTGLPVPLPFRMSAYVPTNLIICAGMLTPNPSFRTLIFWQWANQSLNVCVNYANANKSIAMSNTEVGIAYTAATTTAVLLAVSLNRLVPRIPASVMSAAKRELLVKFVPFASVAGAGVVNITCIRWKEIRDGITVFRLNDVVRPGGAVVQEKEDLGKSSVAGARAVGQSAASRVFTNIPTLILPPLLMTALAARQAFRGPKGKLWENLTHVTAIGLSLYLFLPPSIAVFPQRASVPIGKLEKDVFGKFVDEKVGGEAEKVFFNKGL